MINIKEAQNESDYAEIINMAQVHPEPEYDCQFSVYAKAVWDGLHRDNFKGWIIFDGEKPAGYILANVDHHIMSQVNVVDIYLAEGYRGSHLLRTLVSPVKEWAESEKVKRIMWVSRHPKETWARILNAKVAKYETYIWEVN